MLTQTDAACFHSLFHPNFKLGSELLAAAAAPQQLPHPPPRDPAPAGPAPGPRLCGRGAPPPGGTAEGPEGRTHLCTPEGHDDYGAGPSGSFSGDDTHQDGATVSCSSR